MSETLRRLGWGGFAAQRGQARSLQVSFNSGSTGEFTDIAGKRIRVEAADVATFIL